MAKKTITREEFDRRLEASTEKMRQRRLVLEAQAAELENLVGRYSSILERLEAEAKAKPEDAIEQRKEGLRALLTELAAQSSRVAAAL